MNVELGEGFKGLIGQFPEVLIRLINIVIVVGSILVSVYRRKKPIKWAGVIGGSIPSHGCGSMIPRIFLDSTRSSNQLLLRGRSPGV